MLTIHQALSPKRGQTQSKIGLAIAGGGPVGAIYELGALRALDESVVGLNMHELDVYVGVSSGALIAASLANGISTIEMCRIFMGHEYASIRFDPEHLMRPAFKEYFQRAAMLPGVLADGILKLIRHPVTSNVSQLVGQLGKIIPSGIFDNESIHDFLEHAFRVTGHSNSFDDLKCALYIVAVDLDSGAAIRFGSEGFRDVSIARAVQASAALPGLYPPVEINGHYFVDGALRRTLHASVALNAGVDLLIGVNPLVPFDSGEKGLNAEVSDQRLTRGGLPLILSQTFRALIQSRMEAGFRKYYSSHPFADLLLMEPHRQDERIFFTNIFSYSSRNALCEHSYQATRKDLLARQEELGKVLGKRGMSLNLELLNDSSRTLADSVCAGRSSHAPVTRSLSRVLDELDDLLDRRKAS
jgi:predicted acylesterase/phospholipase RssA